MKNLLSFLSLLLVGIPLLSALPQKTLASENLIANPSVEVSSQPNLPNFWNHGSVWGNLTVKFSYENTGYQSDKSVKVLVTNYVNGDAKWYFNHVNVISGKKYQYSNYYKSDVGTELVAEIVSGTGQTTYQWLAWTAPSNAWKNVSAEFTAPVDAQKVTVLHLLLGNGYLQTDNFSLTAQEESGSNIPNPGFEQSDPSNPNMPIYWHTNSWGTNQASFSYLDAGYQSAKSVRIDMSGYQSGDAKWWYDPIDIVPGETYVFSNKYKSNISTRAVVWVVTDTGSNAYLGLKNVPASSNWATYHDSFTAPFNARQATVFHLVETNGYLIVDDYLFDVGEILGFNRPIVSLTFDDGWEDNTFTALPVMAQYGFKSTQFYATGFINGEDYQSLENIRQFINQGHEIGSHSITHPDLTTLSPKQLDRELRLSKSFLESTFGIKIDNFASPFGAYNQNVINAIGKYYRSHRTVDVGYNSKDNFDRMRLKVQNMTPTVTMNEYNGWLQHAKDNNLWLILVYHKVSDNNIGAYDTTIDQFVNQMSAVNDSDITVLTVNNAITEISAQL